MKKMSLNTWVQLSTATDRESKVRERQLKSGEKGEEVVEMVWTCEEVTT